MVSYSNSKSFFLIFSFLLIFSFQNCSSSSDLPSKSSSSTNETTDTLVLVEPNLSISKNILDYGEALNIEVTNPQSGVTYDWYINDVLEVKNGGSVLNVVAVHSKHNGLIKAIANGEKVSNQVAIQVGHPTSCKQINTVTGAGASPDGYYTIDADGALGGRTPEDVYCLNSMNGGGWTRVRYSDARDLYSGALTELEAGTSASLRTDNRGPVSRDTTGNHAYRFQFRVPNQFSEFFLRDYKIQANSPNNDSGDTSEINGSVFMQTIWGSPHNSDTYGDVSFGGGGDAGPTVSYGSLGTDQNCLNCEINFPNTNIYRVANPTRNFRIEWGESGTQSEGWFPWEGGQVYVR